jgi:hypothetical protein
MRYRRLTATLFLLLICAISAHAQSGRRKTQPPPAAPVPTPTPEPTPVPKKDEKEPEVIILVGADRQGAFSIPIVYYDVVVRSCADRLRTKSAAIDMSERDLSRGEAIKKAKAEAKTYVVLLSLSFDSMSNSYDDLQVDFVVFAPGTAKVVTTGRSYLNPNRAGPLIVGPTPRGSELYRQQMLRQAGEEAANRIWKSINSDVVKSK